jgi:putative flippase GtrA
MSGCGVGKRWLKFNAVGTLGILVQLAVLAALTSWLDIGYLLATGLAVEAAIVHNFFWHERFTWSDRWRAGSSLGRFLRFSFTTGALSILGNLISMKLFAGVLHIPYLLANGLSIATCSLVNFVVSDRFVFRPARAQN